MSQKTFKYGHLYTTSASTAPANGSMIPGEIALGLKSGEEKLWAFDGTNIIDLGSALGGISTDEKTIHKKLVSGQKQLSTLVYLKDVTETEQNIPQNVKKRYRLVDANGDNIVTDSGDTSAALDIYKDSSIVEIYLGTSADTVNVDTGAITKESGTTADKQYLNYVYMNNEGKYYMVKIDLRAMLVEPEFESGVTVNANGVVIGVVDPSQQALVTLWNDNGTSATTASGLTVGANGFKLDNIQTAINAKHANTIKLNGYTSGVTEDLFGIVSGDTVTAAFKKVEDKLEANGSGVAQGGGAEPNNTGIVFVEGGANIVILSAGEY